jgi:cation diffusion facilitator CzcD-associated flavoprotein CzcO
MTARMISEAIKGGRDPTTLGPTDYLKAYHLSDDEMTEAIRARTDEIVKDKKTADNLKAWYRQYCKRPCFHDEYLPTFNLPSVHLVDTNGEGIDSVDETGVWANGQHYDLDVLVYATGFEFGSDYTFRSGLEVYGRDGVTLSETWKDGMVSFQGMHVHNFPNLFIIGFVQGGSLVANVTSNYTDAGVTLAKILTEEKALGARTIEVSQEAQDAWVNLVLSGHGNGIIGGPDCTPGYYNSEGQEEGRREALNFGRYPKGSAPFFQYVAEWRDNGKFEGLEFDGKPVPE